MATHGRFHPRLRAGISKLGVSGVLLCMLLGVGMGCANLMIPGAGSFQYFGQPDPDDPWSRKIAGWQRREIADAPAAPPEAELRELGRRVAAPPEPVTRDAETAAAEPLLRSKYAEFRAEGKRRLARELATWIQDQAQSHYVADGPIDHWATLEETLRKDGDDCDGLELLTYHALRDLGFAEDEVFRAIVVRPSDGQHHMVTLWFEQKDDPWVIDPTGAMTTGMPRMSQLPQWVPLKVFSEDQEYTVSAALPLRPRVP